MKKITGKQTIINLGIDNELTKRFHEPPLVSVKELAREYLKKYPENTSLKIWEKYISCTLGLKRTKEEVNEIRRIKSSNPDNNPDYKVKYDLLKAIEMSEFKTVDNLVDFMNKTGHNYQYIVDNYLGNKEENYISSRALEKIVIKHPNYIKKNSRSENSFAQEIKEIFSDYEIILKSRKIIPPKELDIYTQTEYSNRV